MSTNATTLSHDMPKLRTALKLLREIDFDRMHVTMCKGQTLIEAVGMRGSPLWDHVHGCHDLSVILSTFLSDCKDEIDGVNLEPTQDQLTELARLYNR